MSTDTGTPPASARPAPSPDGWTRRDRVAGWVLLVTWVALVAAAFVTGERASTFGHLEGLVAAGEVSEVEVVGEPLLDESIGYAGIQVRWREGWVLRSASVTQASNARQAVKARRANGSPVIIGSVEDHLRRLDPDVTLSRGEHRSPSFEMGGFERPAGSASATWGCCSPPWSSSAGRARGGPPAGRGPGWCCSCRRTGSRPTWCWAGRPGCSRPGTPGGCGSPGAGRSCSPWSSADPPPP